MTLDQRLLPFRIILLGTAGSLLAGLPALAQQPTEVTAESTAQEPAANNQLPGDLSDELESDADEIVVVGSRARDSAIGDIPPENQLGPRDIRATGATDIGQLLEALAPQLGSARGRGGERPIMLLNGQRISSFRELRDIPTEAILRMDILPEEVALKYGYRADQRVVNIVLRPRFRSTVAQIEGGTATGGGYARGELDLDRLMIGENGRTMISLDADANDALSEAERDIAFDPSSGGPDARDFRTLIGSRRYVRGGATVNRQVFGDVSGTFNGELERNVGRSLFGLSDVLLDPLVRNVTSETAHLGAVLNGNRPGGWRWSATGNADLAHTVTRSDREDEAARDRSSATRRSADIDFMANGPLLTLPAGELGATFRTGVGRLDQDSSRQRARVSTSTDLGRTRAFASANLDLPISRRNRDFSALGNLTLNGNAEVEQLSDFGTLTTVGAGLNWSPLDRLNLLASWTREEGAPSIQQLGDPILETPGTRVFDFTRGETVEVRAITGGNPDLLADRRSVLKVGGNWKPFEEKDLRLRAEYVRSLLKDPVSSFPGPSAALEAAFPERFVRDQTGQLIIADLRPVNYDEARRDTLRWGVDFSKPLQSRRPPQALIDQWRARRGATDAPGASPNPGAPRQQAPVAPEGAAGAARPEAAPPARVPGGGGFGGRFGGRQGGRLNFSLTHTLNLVDEVTIRPGVPDLDYLRGDAVGQFGGRPRHEIEANGGWFNNGLGARVSANWRSGTRVENWAGDELSFSPHAKFDLRLFANLGERFELVSKYPWLRGTSLRLEVDNLFDSKPRVRNAAGQVPVSYQPDLLDPLGRTVSVSVRKLFLPPPSFFRRTSAQP